MPLGDKIEAAKKIQAFLTNVLEKGGLKLK